jgi:hypothetical protein
VGEEPLGLAQEGALALGAPQLLQESEGYDLRVREALEPLVPPPARIEEAVGIVYEAEQHGYGLFRAGEACCKVGPGHPELLWSGVGRMALFLLANRATDI